VSWRPWWPNQKWKYGGNKPVRLFDPDFLFLLNVPVYPSEFLGTPYTHKTRMNFGNIIRGQEVIGEKQKNVNGREIETGSGRGQMTSSSGSGLRGQRHV